MHSQHNVKTQATLSSPHRAGVSEFYPRGLYHQSLADAQQQLLQVEESTTAAQSEEESGWTSKTPSPSLHHFHPKAEVGFCGVCLARASFPRSRVCRLVCLLF